LVQGGRCTSFSEMPMACMRTRCPAPHQTGSSLRRPLLGTGLPVGENQPVQCQTQAVAPRRMRWSGHREPSRSRGHVGCAERERCRVLGVLYKCAAGAGVPVTGIIEYSCEWRFKSSAAGCADCEGRLQPRTTFDGHGTRTHAQARTGGANVPGIRLHSASWGRHRGQQLCELLVGSKAAIGTVTRRHHLSQSIGLRRPPAGCEYS
jgi:hypothetical protein